MDLLRHAFHISLVYTCLTIELQCAASFCIFMSFSGQRRLSWIAAPEMDPAGPSAGKSNRKSGGNQLNISPTSLQHTAPLHRGLTFEGLLPALSRNGKGYQGSTKGAAGGLRPLNNAKKIRKATNFRVVQQKICKNLSLIF